MIRAKLLALTFVAALSGIVVGCSSQNDMPNNAPAVNGQQLDGQTLYRGVYFKDGPAANLFDGWGPATTDGTTTDTPAFAAAKLRDLASAYRAQHWTTTAANLESIASAVEAGQLPVSAGTAAQKQNLIAYTLSGINAQDPTFFTRFSNAMASGSQTRVNSAVKEGTRRLVAFVASVGARQAARAQSGATKTQNSGGGATGSGANGDGSGSSDSSGDNDGLDSNGDNGDDPGNTGDDDQNPGDQASLYQVNVAVFHDTAAVSEKVVAAYALWLVGQNDTKSNFAVAAYVDRMTKILHPKT